MKKSVLLKLAPLACLPGVLPAAHAAAVTPTANCNVTFVNASVVVMNLPKNQARPESVRQENRRASDIVVQEGEMVLLGAECTVANGNLGQYKEVWIEDGNADNTRPADVEGELFFSPSIGTHTYAVARLEDGYGGVIDAVSTSVTLTVIRRTAAATPPSTHEDLTLNQLSAPINSVQVDRVRDKMNAVQDRLRRLRIASDLPGLPAASDGQDSQRRRLNVFLDGLDSLLRPDDGNPSDFRVLTRGVTLGADYRLTDAFVLGAALGLSDTDVRFGGSASRQKSKGSSVMAYASWSPVPAAYVSATLMVESSRFDLKRDSGNANISTASTKGSGTGLSVSAGYDFVSGAVTMSPYIRWDRVISRIDGFDETGSPDAVSVSGQRMHSDSSNVGTQIQYAVPVSWGVLLPHARIELSRHAESVQSAPSARLLSDNTSLLIPTSAGADRNTGLWSVGVSGIAQHGLTWFIDYESGFAQRGYHTERISLGLRKDL